MPPFITNTNYYNGLFIDDSGIKNQINNRNKMMIDPVVAINLDLYRKNQ